jgi:hypothetical protein
MPQIEPLHADGTVCEHPTAPSGKPRDPDSGCTGRHQYRAGCECGWEDHDPIRESLKYARELHKTKAAAEADAAETGRCTPRATVAVQQAAAVSVTYKRSVREVPCRLDWPTSRLLAESVRAHGLKFAANAHLRLYVGGRPHALLPADANSVGVVGICSGDALDLKAPEPQKEAS